VLFINPYKFFLADGLAVYDSNTLGNSTEIEKTENSNTVGFSHKRFTMVFLRYKSNKLRHYNRIFN